MSAGHDFGPGVSTLTTELLHHVCLAVYAVCGVPLFFKYVELQITNFKIYPCHYHDHHHNRQIAICKLQIANYKFQNVPGLLDNLPPSLPRPPAPPPPTPSPLVNHTNSKLV